MGKTKFVLVQLKSIITGHIRFQIRERAAEKSELIAYDPMLRRKVLYKESKKVKGKEEPGKPLSETW